MSKAMKGLTIYFNDGTKLVIEYPPQFTEEYNMLSQLNEVLENKHFLIEADGAMVFIPVHNIKYIQVYPSPEKLPSYAILAASIIES